jgi:hypothetical protein
VGEWEDVQGMGRILQGSKHKVNSQALQDREKKGEELSLRMHEPMVEGLQGDRGAGDGAAL